MYKSNRARTRDLLLEYDTSIMPPRADLTELNVIYPWRTMELNKLKDDLYSFASSSGYIGTQEEFNSDFGSYLNKEQQKIVFEYFISFPEEGETDKLYFDLEEKILYYWTGTNYAPVNTMLITNTILNGGEA